MATTDFSAWFHEHVFDETNPLAERNTKLVMWITAVMMVIEIAAGWWFNSMALLADGWHMSSHALAIGLSAFAYGAARRYARDPRFAFGTWKIEVLGGFASALFLLGVAALMVVGSIERLVDPQPIHYLEAIVIGVVGLAVNIACALILGQAHHHHGESAHGHGHSHGHSHDHGHAHGESHAEAHATSEEEAHASTPAGAKDLNLRSAYVHVIADAATSVLAIAALVGGWLLGWNWLDPAMGVAGAVVVALWAKGLLAETGKVLLDREMDHPLVAEIREVVEADSASKGTLLTDLHVWRVGKSVYACALTLVTHDPNLTPSALRHRLAVHEEIVHATIEIHLCAAEPQGLAPQELRLPAH